MPDEVLPMTLFFAVAVALRFGLRRFSRRLFRSLLLLLRGRLGALVSRRLLLVFGGGLGLRVGRLRLPVSRFARPRLPGPCLTATDVIIPRLGGRSSPA